MQNSQWSQQRAQIGVVVLLITSVVLIFGLSIANRVVKENKLVIDQSDATRVFNVAEDGVDEALNQIYEYELNGTDLTGLSSDDQQINIAQSEEFVGYVDQGDNLHIDIQSGQTGTITLNWSKITCDEGASDLMLTLNHFSSTTGEYENHYYLIGNCADSIQNFMTPNSTPITPYQFAHQLTIDISNNNDATLYIQSINGGTELSLSATVGLIANSQYQILSLAKNTDETSNKAIEVKKSLPSAPGFMSFALFSGGSILK